MRQIDTSKNHSLFKVLTSTASAQAAMMTLKAGESSSDELENEHPRCEQWLFVIAGQGTAQIEKHKVTIKQGTLLLIEKAEKHQITNTGKYPLVTINLYAPPAYRGDGQVKPSAKK